MYVEFAVACVDVYDMPLCAHVRYIKLFTRFWDKEAGN